ncbi:protein SPEAR3-like [Telopea speciosissima]|uniref:protein SPEAR3-like n=1 Tax=Telopea speciosissima TaxID=54955 RepID=UPI001CC3D717|nr:protein SPEAR3-like [Telopea speciosissima]
MGSNNSGESSMGNGRTGFSSKKGKKNHNYSEKQKKPQRGLGVAQLEKLRLESEMSYCNYLPSLHNPYHHHIHLNQEEETRLGTTYYSSVPSASSFSYSSSSTPLVFHPNIMMDRGEIMEATDFRYGDSQSRWNNSNGYSETQYSLQPTDKTGHLMSQNVKDSLQKKRRTNQCDSIGSSSSQNSDSSDMKEEIDLELKL